MVDFLRRFAVGNHGKDIGKTFVLEDESGNLHGFVTLAAASIDKSVLPEDLAAGLPGFPVPAALVARLAVQLPSRGQGMAEQLMQEAFRRILSASESLAIRLVMVDALSPDAARFWEKQGFVPAPSAPLCLFLPVATLRAANTSSKTP